MRTSSGAAHGAVGALIGELAQRGLYVHAETHLDPRAASIITSLLLAGLALAGWFPPRRGFHFPGAGPANYAGT